MHHDNVVSFVKYYMAMLNITKIERLRAQQVREFADQCYDMHTRIACSSDTATDILTAQETN
jgi:hypothetical protein